MSLLDYEPIHLAFKFHKAPRFGGSNDISDLASEELRMNYFRGVNSFSSIILVAVFVWLMVLLYLKCSCRSRGGRPMCASGGGVIHIKELREVHHLSRSQRKTIIRRQWRVQGLALLFCALVIPANLVGIQLGLHPFLESLQDIREVNDQIESKVYQGLDIGHRLERYYQNLTQLPMLDMTTLCPKHFSHRTLITPTLESNSSTVNVPRNGTELFGDILEWTELVTQGLDEINNRFEGIQIPKDALHLVTNATNILDYTIDLVVENDWYVKLGLLVLNVVVLFWSLGILVAQNNIIWIGMHRVAAYFLMPVMFLLLPSLLVAAFGFAALLVINAGSISNMIERLHGTALDETLHYYSMNCLAENPLQFLDAMEWELTDTLDAVDQIKSELGVNMDSFISFCDPSNATMTTLESTLSGTRVALSGIRGSITAAVQLTECSSITPIFRRLVYGATCKESIQSMTAMFGSTVALLCLILLLLTTRSALFSPIIRGRRTKRRETEFKEYKKYMSQFYETKGWNVDWVPADENELVHEIKRTGTQSTASPTSSDESDTVMAHAFTPTPHRKGDFVNSGPIYEEDEEEDNDSYDSTYSSDSEEDAESMVSGWSRFMKNYSVRTQGQAGGLNESYSTTSTIFSDARRIMTNIVSGQAALSLLASVRDRYSSQQAHQYEDSDDDDLSTNSIPDRESCLMTPEPLRYTARGRFSSSNKKRREDPEDFEMIALSPRQTHAPNRTATDIEKKALARRFGHYK